MGWWLVARQDAEFHAAAAEGDGTARWPSGPRATTSWLSRYLANLDLRLLDDRKGGHAREIMTTSEVKRHRAPSSMPPPDPLP